MGVKRRLKKIGKDGAAFIYFASRRLSPISDIIFFEKNIFLYRQD